MKSFLFSLVVFLVFVSCSKDDVKLQVFSKDATIEGYTYPKLSEEFNKWIFGKSIETSPLSDEDGSLHQTQPLKDFIILSPNLGGTSTRSLTISQDKNVFIPVMGVSYWYYDKDPCDLNFKLPAGQTPKTFLAKEIEGILETASNMELTLNGEAIVPDITKYKITSDVFTMSVGSGWNDPNCDYSKLTANALSEDYSVCVKLPKGKHVLKVKGRFEDINLVQYISWNLTVN